MSISVLVADDHPIVRHGVRALLHAEPDFRLLGEVDNGLDVIRRVEELEPDVLVLDLVMPGLNGLDVTSQVKRRWPEMRIIVLSMYSAESYVLQALKRGADGYVLKKSSPDELVQAIREVAAGRSFLSRSLSARAIDAYRERARDLPDEPYDRLTDREREVLHLVIEGHTSAEIGRRLFISPRTVESHRGNLMRKLGVDNQAALIQYAYRRGLLAAEDDAPSLLEP